ncbi:exosortase/archaeosortase family protein [Modestobacter sp. VKM Ac-2986]|uniref:exosortase/archaeosortase family protein n=1 Tax=Modestobacter sp. VKM Ac-2986 TaxID=3004140 RepID=UPI0022AA204E|nr:exosortase/archaeosortase family protein [Modestobacter sp. VKM Ac-2986]MCZ2827825.1 exosortase/archaeosortase family protein [Modestobacter sp. VKM Ac-2986]
MADAVLAPPVPRRLRATSRRQLAVLADLLLAGAICLVGYRYGTHWLQVQEASWVVGLLHLFGVDSVSGVLPTRILIFRADGELLNAVVTASCSSILSVVGLTALTASVLRSRRWHAVAGLAVAIVAVLVANHVRLLLSTVIGLQWGGGSLVLFHDWVGTLWNLAATLGGFLLMVYVTLPPSVRAEQDVAGRHTARRPSSWARPGLGYRLPETDQTAPVQGRNLAGLVHRFLLPRRISRWLGARRETARIDYRIGHLPVEGRVKRVGALAADGLGAHTASLLAVATYEQDGAVLDALADAIAARQWEPVTNERVSSLRLWARGWTLSRGLHATVAPAPAAVLPAAPAPAAAPVPAPVVPTGVPRPPVPRRTGPTLRSFARPAPSPSAPDAEDPR